MVKLQTKFHILQYSILSDVEEMAMGKKIYKF